MTTTPSPSFIPVDNTELIEKLQLVVEGENAAVWAFGFLSSFFDDADETIAISGYNLHRDNRDKARLRLRNLGITPARPMENYQLPFEVSSLPTAYQLAAFVENRLIGIYIQLFAIEYKENRLETLQLALDGSIRYLEFKEKPKALPGNIN